MGEGLAAATADDSAMVVLDGTGVGLADGDGLGLALGAGLAVGGAVGGGVGGAVGGGVGRGVGVGVGGGAVVAAGPSTMMVPFIDGWNVQWYANVPARLKVMVLPPSGAIGPVSKAPVSDVAVCSRGSLFDQLTLSPALIVMVGGMKVKLWMATVWTAAQTGMVREALIRTTAAAMRSTRVRRIR